MTFTAGKAASPARKSAQQGSGRRVRTGILPEFAFSGQGVKIQRVDPDSPSSKAGLKSGDVVVSFNGIKVTNLQDYSNLLKEHKPGDEITLTVKRGDQTLKVKLQLESR